MKNYLQKAIEASVQAGNEILKVYEQEDFGVQQKEDESPLTKADLAAHKVILSILEKFGIPVLSEEGLHAPYSHRKNWHRLWVVDPLDGTKEFIKRNGEFTVNIALVEDQKPILGVIYVPVLKLLYYAAEEIGAFKAEEIADFTSFKDLQNIAQQLPLKNNSTAYTVVVSKSHLSEETEKYISDLQKEHKELKIISKGSSLKICMVAEGKTDIYPRFGPTMEWDTAAGHAICTCAGKNLIDYKTGKEMIYNREELKNNSFVVK